MVTLYSSHAGYELDILRSYIYRVHTCPHCCRHLQCLVDCAVHFTQESLEVSLGQCAATLLLDKALTGEQAPEEVRQLTENAQVHAVDVNTPISFFSTWKKTNQPPSGKWSVWGAVCTPTHTPNDRPMPDRQDQWSCTVWLVCMETRHPSTSCV